MIIIVPTQKESDFFRKKHYCMNGAGKIEATLAIADNKKHKDILLMGTCCALDKTPMGTIIVSRWFFEWDMNMVGLGGGVKLGENALSGIQKNRQIVTAAPKLNYFFGDGQIVLYDSIMTGDTFLTDKKLAKKLMNEFTGCKFLDMESAAMAKACNYYGVRFQSIKVVTDNADNKSKDNWLVNCAKAMRILSEIKIYE